MNPSTRQSTKMNVRKIFFGVFIAAFFAGALPAVEAQSLRLVARTELPGYTGDFDHFEYDLKGNRLWLAAEDHGTLDVFDLITVKRLVSVIGVVDSPHGILYVPSKQRLIVTDSGGDMVTRIIDAGSNKPAGAIKLAAPGADAMGYDASRQRLYIVNGGRDAKMQETYLSVLDPVTLERHGDLRFDTDKVEAMVIEQKGPRLYINVTGKNQLAVVDKDKLAILATWPITEAEQNAAIAFDETSKRLFVVTRKPGKLIVLDADTGAILATFKAPERSDAVSPGEGKTGAAILRFDVDSSTH